MSNVRYFFFTCLALSTLFWNLIICQNELRSEIRFTKAENCNGTQLKWFLTKVNIYSQYPRTFVNAVYNVTKDIRKFNKFVVKVVRCNDEGFNCEYFQTWSIPNFCPMLLWKNQPWSEFLESVHPKLRCPLKKMEYEVRNASIDLNDLIKWYPEFAKYRWRGESKFFDDHDDLVFCGIYEVHVNQYVKRNRKND